MNIIGQKMIQSRKIGEKTYRNRDFLYKEYIIKNKPSTQIANELGVSDSIIRKYLSRLKITIIPRSERYKNQYPDIIGKQFNQLKVLSFNDEKTKRQNQFVVNCRCDCGEFYVTSLFRLRTQKSKHCGSFRHKCHGEITYAYFTQLKRGAKDRDLEFNISIAEIWNLFLKQERKCVFSGKELLFGKSQVGLNLQTASLDRIDSTKGYITGNLQWVHRDINFMKRSLPDSAFLELIKEIYNYRLNGFKTIEPIYDESR